MAIIVERRALVVQRRTLVFLRNHGQGERGFFRSLWGYFSNQARRIADAVRDFLFPSPTIIGQFFNEQAEADRLMKIAHPHLLQMGLTGAQTELSLAGRPEAPRDVFAAVRRAIDELERQPYWKNIQRTTAANLGDILKQGLEDGLSSPQLAKRLQAELGGKPAKKRALTIARTESTGALNAGHFEGMQELARADAGLVIRKEWSTTLDADTRPDHSSANAQTVAVDERFSVGGFLCPYPGWFGLPARQRINCRCTVITDFGG